MRTRRAILFPAILALAAAGSFLAGSSVPLASAQAHSTHVVASPYVYYHG
jgi:hypothetical protein